MKRQNKGITKLDQYESIVFSILKCQYGWPSMLADGQSFEEIDQKIAKGFIFYSAHETAEILAIDFAQHGGKFLKRMDGKPNIRTVNLAACH